VNPTADIDVLGQRFVEVIETRIQKIIVRVTDISSKASRLGRSSLMAVPS
jgi:hypothetical protein